MPAVVRERDRLGERHAQADDPGDAGGHLRDLDRVGEARAEVIVFGGDVHLALARESPPRTRVLDPVEVALEAQPVRIGLLGTRPGARTDRTRRARARARASSAASRSSRRGTAAPDERRPRRDARAARLDRPLRRGQCTRSCTIRGYREGETRRTADARPIRDSGGSVPALHPAFDPAERLEADLLVHAVRVAGPEHQPRHVRVRVDRRRSSGTRRARARGGRRARTRRPPMRTTRRRSAPARTRPSPPLGSCSTLKHVDAVVRPRLLPRASVPAPSTTPPTGTGGPRRGRPPAGSVVTT